MSVETVGAQGFDYQYTATLYMILRYLEMDNFKAWIENESFEDAKLSYQLENKIYQIELQVKNRSDAITYDEFAVWLAHFQKRKSDCFILDKIQESDTNYFVIVTNNRCTDDVSKFLGKESEIKENRIHFSKEDLEDLKKRILMGIDDKTQLGKKRKEHIKQYFEKKKTNELNKVFGRVCVIERKEQIEIETEICTFLKKHYQIPENVCRDVMNQMLVTIRKGRDSGENIVKSIKEIIKNKRFTRVLPEDNKFYKRDSIDMLKEELLQKHILLLTGVPFSGKTYIAKTIAQELQEQGYYVKRTDNIIDDQEAYYFFASPENDLRLLLLEDPFGHIKKKDNYIDILDKVKGLVKDKLSSNRKIIITSRIDILFDIFKKSEIENCKIEGNKWNDTSITSIQEAEKIWQLFYGKSKESLRVFKRLSSFFDSYKGLVFLEIGEIRHLLLEVKDIHTLMNMPTDEIIKLARISSEEVCQKIKSYGEDYKDIFILMGCFCDTIRTVNIKDLAYILCSNEGAVSIRKKNQVKVTMTIGRSQKNLHTKSTFPMYTQIIELDKDIKNILRDLCEKGYIYKDRFTNEFYFLHPIYTYASKLLLDEEIEVDWDKEKYIKYMDRAIGSLSSNAAVCSLYRLQQEFDLSQVIINCVVKGSMSIFPRVRDISVLFLDQNFDTLNEQIQKDLIINIKNSRIIDEYIQWNYDECWYQIDEEYNYEIFNMDNYENKDFNITLDEIDYRIHNKKDFSKKEIYEIIYSSLANDLSQEFLEYAMLSDEAIIRSKAVFYLFKNYAVKLDFEKVEYLNYFESCSVVYSMLKGMFYSIENFSDKNIELLIIYFQKQFGRKSISVYFKNLFDKFGDEYKSEVIDWKKHTKHKLKIWKVWASLFSIWLVCFPAKFIEMHEPNMCFNIDQSLKYLKNQQEIVDIVNAWIQWIENYSQYNCVSDYGMSVLNYLIIGTENTSYLREGIIAKELKVNNTSLITSHISHIVDLWNLLTDDERNIICEYLTDETRNDMKWIQAVALTRKKVPEEIQIAITGTIFLDKKVEEIINILNDKKILAECLHVFCGFPQPLWFNGYHHVGEDSLWDGVMMEILKNPISKECYNISLKEFINVLYNRRHRFINGYDLYKKMLCNNENRKQIFNCLAYISVTQNQDNKEMWDCLLQKCSEEEKKQFFSTISSFIEMVEMKNIGYDGLLCEYELKDIVCYILPHFSSDKLIYELSFKILDSYKNIQKIENVLYIEDETEHIKVLVESYEKIVEEIYKNKPPRLLFTNTIVEFICKEIGVQSEIIQIALEKSKEDFWNRFYKIKNDFERECPLKIQYKYSLENWNN